MGRIAAEGAASSFICARRAGDRPVGEVAPIIYRISAGDTVDANLMLGHQPDLRDYRIAAAI